MKRIKKLDWKLEENSSFASNTCLLSIKIGQTNGQDFTIRPYFSIIALTALHFDLYDDFTCGTRILKSL